MRIGEVPLLSKKTHDLLDSEINVLLDTETEASRFTEIAAQQLVLLNLQSTLQELHGFLTTDSHVAGNLLITPDTEGTDSVPCCKTQNQTSHYSPLITISVTNKSPKITFSIGLPQTYNTHPWKTQGTGH